MDRIDSPAQLCQELSRLKMMKKLKAEVLNKQISRKSGLSWRMTSHSFSFQFIFNTPFADRNGGGETLERQKYYEKMYIEHSVTSFLYSHLLMILILGITFLFSVCWEVDWYVCIV